MNGYLIRDYTPGDYDEVASLWNETGMGNEERKDDKETISRCLDKGGRMLILTDRIRSRIAGTSWMTFDGRRIYLHHFGILPEYQGKGLSKILLEESLKHIRESGYQVKLEVHRTNRVAINLYKKYGFKSLGEYEVLIIRNVNDI